MDNNLNKVLKYFITGAGSTAALTFLLNAASEIKDTIRRNKVEENIKNMAKPERVITLRAPMIKNKLDNFDKREQEAQKDIQEEIKKSASADGIIDKLKPSRDNKQLLGDYAGETLKWLSLIGGGAAGIYGVNKLFNYLKQKSLKQELEDAEDQYYTTLFMNKKLQDEENKAKLNAVSSSYKFSSENEKLASISTKVLGGATAALIAVLLGSAYAARQLANAKKPKLDHEELYTGNLTVADMSSPKLKFVIADDDITNNDLDELEEKYKTASVIKREDFLSGLNYAELFKNHAKEMVIKLAAELEQQNGTNGGLNNFINMVALGEIDKIKQGNSLEEMFDISDKFAASNKKIASPVNRTLAVSYLVSDPILSNEFVPYAAKEFLDMAPTYCKIAAYIDSPEAMEDFSAVLTRFNLENNREVFNTISDKSLTKLAAEDADIFNNIDVEDFENMTLQALDTALKSQMFA